jgi:SAM-dependent methyltransferase
MLLMVYNSVLKTSLEVTEAKKRLKEMKLFPHHGTEKSWDTSKMIEIINIADRNAPILDFGCNGSPILPMLKRLGFTNLYGCDLVLKPKYNATFMKIACRFYKSEYLPIVQMYDDGAINLSIQGEKTSYHDDMFEYITSLSVIEHGINMTEYFREMARILKRGGYLLISTDYWPDKITNTKNIISKNNPDNIFSKAEIESLIELADKYGLSLIDPIDYTYSEKVVRWKKTNLEYTFIFFGMRKV